MNYLDTLDDHTREYLLKLEPDFPEWLNNYIFVPALLRQEYISPTCGTIYSDLFKSDFSSSKLESPSSLVHSVATALVVWHFTHNKKQTLAGLFHDIATPAFNHCIDFLDGDYLKQESTEDLTSQIISESPEITKFLERDKIKISEVDNYHLYPIADNDVPQLSADRLEYSLCHMYFTYYLADFETVQKFYQDVEIQSNEEDIPELGFKNLEIAREFVKITSQLSVIYRADKTRYSMQLIADIIRILNKEKKILREDLYRLKESEAIEIIENSELGEIFKIWRKAKLPDLRAASSLELVPPNTYSVHCEAKIRYIDPLVNGRRISSFDSAAKDLIKENLDTKFGEYIYLEGIPPLL